MRRARPVVSDIGHPLRGLSLSRRFVQGFSRVLHHGVAPSTSSSIVGVAEGEGVSCAAIFGPACAGDVGAGDWAARFAPKIETTNVASKNRDITIIRSR